MLDKIKNLREKTGAGMVEIKKALEEADGNEEKAREILRKRGQEKASKKSGRQASEGIVSSYIHSNGKIGSMVKLFCETDFVAKNEEFKTLAQDIAMHITAVNPLYIKPEDVPEEIVEKEKEIWKAQLIAEGKKEEIFSEILGGKEKKFRQDVSLLSQSFVKNPELTVGELVSEKIAKIGENIQVGDFVRFEL